MHIEPIGVISSCFKEKFGIPRQPALASLAQATLEMAKGYEQIEMFDGLEQFSHIWLIFGFHATQHHGWKPSVRPPRLGGNKRVGVFASRSMYRPNSLGLSVCQLDSIAVKSGRTVLNLAGVDLLDGTPVFDIKPYLPYADSISDARGAYAEDKPIIQHDIIFSQLAEVQCKEKQQQTGQDIRLLVEQILQQDPRPSYHAGKQQDRVYGMQLYDMNVRWVYEKVEYKKLNKNREVVKVLSLW